MEMEQMMVHLLTEIKALVKAGHEEMMAKLDAD
jgi:hypothetical protein